MVTEHTLLVVIFKKDGANLLQRLQTLSSGIHQYSIRILYKIGPQLFTTIRLFRHSHTTNRDKEIPGICITINAIKSYMDKSDCIRAERITEVT